MKRSTTALSPERQDSSPSSRRDRRSRSVGDVAELEGMLRLLKSKVPQRGRKIARAIYVANAHWLSVWAKSIIVAYMAAVWFVAVKDCNYNFFEFFKYLTHWGWTIESAYFAYALFLDIQSHIGGGSENLSVIARSACHALSEIAFALQFVIVVMFWAIIYPGQQWRSVLWEIQIHGGGLLIIILDYIHRFAGFSLRTHKYVWLFAVFYCTMHISVVWTTGKVIYPDIDFTNLYSICMFLLGVSATIYIHKGVYLLTHWAYVKQQAANFYETSLLIMQEGRNADETGLTPSLPRRVRKRINIIRKELTTPTRRRMTAEVVPSFADALEERSSSPNAKKDQ